jgi:hypothetical protein
MSQRSTSALVAIGLILLAVASRVARHFGWLELPPNVAPITAVAMFSGAFLPRRLTFVVPLTAMLVSDMLIGFYTLPVMIAVYACFAISNLFGLRLRTRRSIMRLAGWTLAGSTIFFLVTNAAVWAFEGMYPHTVPGLGQAYVAGLPFFRNTVLGDLGYSAVLFGTYALAVVYWRRQHTNVVPSNA